MKFKPAEPNPETDSNAPDVSLDGASDINLYDDLLTFTDLSPEEQKAAMNRPGVSTPPQPQPVENPETQAIYEQAFEPAPETASAPLPDPFFFEPQAEAAKDAVVNTVKNRAVEPKEEPAKEPVSEPPQTNTFDKDNSSELRLAEILRVTGQLNDLSRKNDLMSVCLDCGSPADSEDVFCITCGGALEEVECEAPLSCDDCGSTVVSDEIFCPSCGSAIFGA